MKIKRFEDLQCWQEARNLGASPQLEYWPALARVAWNTMLSLQYFGGLSHKIQSLQARSGPGRNGALACPGATCLEYAVIAVIFRKQSLCK